MLAAALTGAAFGLLHAFLTVPLALSQHVAGLGITLFATSVVVLRVPRELSQRHGAADDPAVRRNDVAARFRYSRRQTPMTLLALVVRRASSRGCSIARRSGSPCARSARIPPPPKGRGSNVNAIRTGAIVAGSALMGVGGAFLTLSAFNAFFFNMVNGRGWICVALVVFASWRPGKALAGALLFAFFDAMQLRLQQSGGEGVPYQVYLMLPYVLSILALVLVARRATYPQALMKPYRKGER